MIPRYRRGTADVGGICDRSPSGSGWRPRLEDARPVRTTVWRPWSCRLLCPVVPSRSGSGWRPRLEDVRPVRATVSRPWSCRLHCPVVSLIVPGVNCGSPVSGDGRTAQHLIAPARVSRVGSGVRVATSLTNRVCLLRDRRVASGVGGRPTGGSAPRYFLQNRQIVIHWQYQRAEFERGGRKSCRGGV